VSDTDLRDNLALERTRLANERTFLAYIRTSLSLIAAGVVILHFFQDQASSPIVAWLLVSSGGIALLIGIVRFFRVRARL